MLVLCYSPITWLSLHNVYCGADDERSNSTPGCHWCGRECLWSRVELAFTWAARVSSWHSSLLTALASGRQVLWRCKGKGKCALSLCWCVWCMIKFDQTLSMWGQRPTVLFRAHSDISIVTQVASMLFQHNPSAFWNTPKDSYPRGKLLSVATWGGPLLLPADNSLLEIPTIYLASSCQGPHPVLFPTPLPFRIWVPHLLRPSSCCTILPCKITQPRQGQT